MTLDIAPFAYRDDEPQHGRLVLRWEEPRDLYRLCLRFPSPQAVPDPDQVAVCYWRCHWPQHRATPADLAAGTIGRAGWKQRDDWFNGSWAPAHVLAQPAGAELHLTFAPLAQREFPDLVDFNVTFRQALKLQVALPPGCPRPEVAVFTDTPLVPRRLTVQLGCGQPHPPPWQGQVEVYNGRLDGLRGPTAADPRLHLALACAQPGPLCYDRTIVTLRSPQLTFSFCPQDLEQGRPIWIPDLGALVAEADWDLRYSPQLAAGLLTGVSCYDAIPSQPEQSLRRALREQPPKEPMHFVLGCEGARQKFAAAPNGDLFAMEGFIRRVPAGDTPRLGWQGRGFALRFGWDDWLPCGRRLAHGYLPVLESRFSQGCLLVRQEAFAVPAAHSILDGPTAADAPIACLLRLAFSNEGDDTLLVTQPLELETYQNASTSDISRHRTPPDSSERLAVRAGLVWATGEREYLRMAAQTEGGELVEGDRLVYRVEVPPGETRLLTLKVPFLGLLTPQETAALQAKDFEAERAQVIGYWRRRLATGMQISTPEPDLNDFARSHLMHVLVNDDHEVGSERIIGRVSSFNYGNYSNEAIMQIMDLDRRGLHQEARRHLATYLHYQGTVALPGNFQSSEGLFYGSGGYECGGYNQHHGWVLWGMAEHYRFTGDREWLLAVAPGLVAGCDWVIRERQATKRTDEAGRRVLEYGFLPAGSLEDVTDYYYWLSTNALTCRGLAAAAWALADAGHPQGDRLVKEAAAFREDLLAGFREAMARAPVVRLRNGSCVPHHPSRLYWRSRDFGWIREVLEGSINLATTVLDPTSQEATWILQDYEDNRYLDAPYNYPLDDFGRDWFSQGGFSMQPNLLYFTPPYLYRDQVEHFLRAFCNGFAACWRADIRAMAEHPLPRLADWGGDHFKSSDESMAMMWLRMMFVQEDGDTLYLGRGLPRAWLAGEEGVAIRQAATYFGPVSLEIRPLQQGARLVASIDPPRRRPPARIIVRFRHPRRARLAAATLDGRPVADLDPDREWVVLPALAGPATLEARFSSGQ